MSGFVQAAAAFTGMVSGIVALIVSALNAWNYSEDRNNRAQQESFQNQLGIARVYFERIATNFCSNRQEATLLVKIVEHSAGRTRIGSGESGDDPLVNLARVMETDFRGRSCAGDAQVGNAAPEIQGVATVAAAQPNSTYGFKEQVRGTASRTRQDPSYTVYIQYRSPGSLDRARQLQTNVDRDPQYVSPALDQVEQVPSRDEIRIYKLADQPVATALRDRYLPGARIVNLEKAYPNLQARTLEVWLTD